MLSVVTSSTLKFFVVFLSPSRKILLIVPYLNYKLLPRTFQLVTPVILPKIAVKRDLLSDVKLPKLVWAVTDKNSVSFLFVYCCFSFLAFRFIIFLSLKYF